MKVDDFFIVLSAIAAIISAAINLTYYFTHSNGKKYIRLLSGVSMIYVIAIVAQRLFHVRVITMSEIWPFIPLLLLFPAADAWVDWNKNKLPIDKRMDDRINTFLHDRRKALRRKEDTIPERNSITRLIEKRKKEV